MVDLLLHNYVTFMSMMTSQFILLDYIEAAFQNQSHKLTPT